MHQLASLALQYAPHACLAGFGWLVLSSTYRGVRGLKRRIFGTSAATNDASARTDRRPRKNRTAASSHTTTTIPARLREQEETTDHDRDVDDQTLPARELRLLNNDLMAAHGPAIGLEHDDPRIQTIELGRRINDVFQEGGSYRTALDAIHQWLLDAASNCKTAEQVSNYAELVDLYHCDKATRSDGRGRYFSINQDLIGQLTTNLLDMVVGTTSRDVNKERSRDLLRNYLRAQVDGSDLGDETDDVVQRFVQFTRSVCTDVVRELHTVPYFGPATSTVPTTTRRTIESDATANCHGRSRRPGA